MQPGLRIGARACLAARGRARRALCSHRVLWSRLDAALWPSRYALHDDASAEAGAVVRHRRRQAMPPLARARFWRAYNRHEQCLSVRRGRRRHEPVGLSDGSRSAHPRDAGRLVEC